jgi:hypothetical protein
MKMFLIGTLGFSSLLLPIQATAETVRGVNRELAGENPVDLGTAVNYAILSKTGISTVPSSAITGNIAVSPIASTAITGFSLILDLGGRFSKSSQVTGVATAATYGGPVPSILTTAVLDMEAAYTDAAGRANADAARINLGDGELGGVLPGGPTDPLTPGVYTFSTNVYLKGNIHFNSGGDPDAIFIIQMAGSLFQSGGYQVILDTDVQAKNIFWQVAGLVNVGAGAHMEGIILAKTSVTFMNLSTLDGRILAQTACNLLVATINSSDAALE